MGIRIVQLHFGNLPYFAQTSAINKAFADRWGYQYGVFGVPDEPMDYARKSYYKIPPVLDAIKAGDMVLYLDADAYVRIHEMPIERVAEVYFVAERTAAIFGDNALDSHRVFSRNQVNAGVFLFRPHEKSEAILTDWWNSYHPETLPATADEMDRWHRTSDQQGFNTYVLPKYSDHINIVRTPEFGGRDGQFIRHWMLMDNPERERLIAQDSATILKAPAAAPLQAVQAMQAAQAEKVQKAEKLAREQKA